MSERTARVAGADRSPEATRAALEEERAFLIRSLRDLDDERDAGDIDAADYEALRDDYTVRAAALLRRLEGDDAADVPAGIDPGAHEQAAAAEPDPGDEPGPRQEAEPRAPRRGGRRRRAWSRKELAVVGAIVVALAGLGGWEVGHGSSGGSGPLSATQVEQLLQRAESEVSANPVAAIKDYNKILKDYPGQVQALTEVGWVYAQAGELSAAQASLEKAEASDPTYDPAHGYLGVVYFGQDNYAGAVTQLTYYLAHGPNPTLASQARQALAAAQKDLKATSKPSTSGSPPPSPTTTARG